MPKTSHNPIQPCIQELVRAFDRCTRRFDRSRPSKRALLIDFHDLLADLHRMSGLWMGAAMHIEQQLGLMRQVFNKILHVYAPCARDARGMHVGCAHPPARRPTDPLTHRPANLLTNHPNPTPGLPAPQ